jgi:hypothetical protein
MGATLALWAVGRVLRPEPLLSGGPDRPAPEGATERLDTTQGDEAVVDEGDREQQADGFDESPSTNSP